MLTESAVIFIEKAFEQRLMYNANPFLVWL